MGMTDKDKMSGLENRLDNLEHMLLAALGSIRDTRNDIRALREARMKSAQQKDNTPEVTQQEKSVSSVSPAPTVVQTPTPTPTPSVPLTQPPISAPTVVQTPTPPISAAQTPAVLPSSDDQVTMPSTEVQVAGYTLRPPPGKRWTLPPKEELIKKGLDLGISQAELDTYFKKGERPSDETKYRFLLRLDLLMRARQPSVPAPVTQAPQPVAQTPVAPQGINLAGFSLVPPAAKGDRWVLPTKDAILKRGATLGMSKAELSEVFPQETKPSNDMKWEVLRKMDARYRDQAQRAQQPPLPVPVPVPAPPQSMRQ